MVRLVFSFAVMTLLGGYLGFLAHKEIIATEINVFNMERERFKERKEDSANNFARWEKLLCDREKLVVEREQSAERRYEAAEKFAKEAEHLRNEARKLRQDAEKFPKKEGNP